MAAKLTKAIADLQEEKELNQSLTHNQSSWHQRVAQLETQVQKIRDEKETSVRELQEQLQDVMLYFEAQEKFKNTELEGGQVVSISIAFIIGSWLVVFYIILVNYTC